MSGRLRRALLRFAYRVYGLRWQLLRPVTVGVRMMLVQDGTVILIRHSYQEFWLFPGGGVKTGESLLQAGMREAREEVGAVVLDTPRLLGIFSNFGEGKSDHVALFVSESYRLEAPTDRWEIEERLVVPLDKLPADTPVSIRRHIQQYRDGSHGLTGEW